ncbi:TIGR03503 family protein [Pseudoalteromonas sp. T1lg23B]|uniref:TIGR03503 family protein n=1 Tax=Pseudoalteromonas sp. T1lg23B TaxID=2077097 RepID=UPI000CF5F5D6|nr:TIGR03503 family protein [Pseudoalteromonas sp. T1lg23B]
MKRLWFALFMIMVTTGVFATPQVTVLERDGVSNEVPLLDNRFRIDHEVEKISLLFFRKPGSPAVVLVQPDGSKIYATHALRDDSLQWYDEVSFDLVVISNPTPGPWQVIGNIQDGSRVMVVGDIELEVEPLPPLIFRGETLKVTGRVTNDGKPIEIGYFRDVISLVVDFVSTNNDNYDNFGAGTQSVTEFKDDGREFDERPLDGVFTGEFKLSFPAGEWRPEFLIETPLVKRKVVGKPILLSEPPFNFELTLSEDEEFEHELMIKLDNEIVKPESVIFQGKIFYPNGEEQAFTIEPKERLYRTLAIKNYDWGRYSVELSAFGENINGREFMATLPVYKFEIERPIEKVPELLVPIETILIPEPEPEPEINTPLVVSIIVVGNLLILLAGWVAVRVLVQNKPINFKFKLPFMKSKHEDKQSQEPQNETQKQNVDESGSKNDKSGDILNLSMSDD